MMSHRILPAALLLCALSAACGELPTRNDIQAHPAGPAYDGGFTMGSGNSATQSSGYTIGSGGVESQDGGYGMGSGNDMVEDGGFTIGSAGTLDSGPANNTTSGDSVGRGGYGMGSGN
jgi:hypothetical protein